ncbi:nephrin-like [Osmerus eperlanus]|uniref:nephrin-like n=1 Tax=Osmerus eperlanus TaxID=29151 RepID=UPI002E158151
MLLCQSHGGNPLATLQWTKNGEVLSTSWEEDTVARRSSSLLPLEVLPQDNQALLGCEATNLVSKAPLSILRRLTVHFEPKEVKVLGSFNAVEGKEVSLSCSSSSSNPPVQIRWWLGFQELNSTSVVLEEGDHGGMTSMSNLTHLVSREENGLPLTCETFNKGTRFSKSQSTNLQVFYPPQKVWLDGPPEDIPLRSGTTVHLVCFSSGGNPTGTLTWYKNGRAVEASRHLPSDKGVSRELVLLLQPSDNQANYRCDATNSAKKTLSASSKLLVQFPATSVKIEARQSVLHSGQTLQLECLTGSSNPQTNISWSLGPKSLQGVDLVLRNAMFGGVSVRSSLPLPLESQHHGKRVVCQAYSSLLSEGVNTFYQLDVLFPPEFSPDQPKQVQIQEDEVATLPLLVSANPDEVSCSWLYGKEPLREGDEVELEIVNATRRDAGVYTAQCTNELGSSHTSITLDVLYAPSVRAEVNPVYVDVEGTADLLCVADANPVPSGMFSWKWLGEMDGEMDIGEEIQREETGLLTILEATRASAGRYQCTADNGIAPPASVEVELVVRFKPELQKGPQWTKVASRGDGTSTAEVVCQAEGIPKVEFSWAKDGVPMDFSNPRYEEQTVRESFIHISTVKVVNVSAALDYVVFTCGARNPLGEDSLDIQLLSTNHPDPPSGLSLLDVTHNSITLEWIPGFDGGLEQRFRVRYRWAQSASFLYVDVYPPKANVFAVTGLSPATAYNLSVNALNAIGESSYADNNAVLTITTEGQLEGVVDTEEPGRGSEKDSDLSTSLLVSLGVGGVLLLINMLGCFLVLRWRKRRGQTESPGESESEGKKSEEERSTLSTVSSSSRYEVRERVNPSAQHTLLMDSGSEPDGSVYESYGAESCHYYYPTGDYRPSLLPVPEGPPTYGARYPGESHEYEEVRARGLYQDVLPPSLPPPPSYAGPRVPQAVDRRPPLLFPERGGRGTAFREQPIRINDRTADGPPQRSDYDLPFELRGELV